MSEGTKERLFHTIAGRLIIGLAILALALSACAQPQSPAGDVEEEAATAVEEGEEDVEEGAEDVEEDVEEGAEDVEEDVEEGAEDVEEDVEGRDNEEETPTEEDDEAAEDEEDDEAAEDEDDEDAAAAEGDDVPSEDLLGEPFAGPGERVENEAGFSFVVPEGWEAAFNTAFEGAGVATLVPEGIDFTDPEATNNTNAIVITAGALSDITAQTGADLPDDPDAEDLIDFFLEDAATDQADIGDAEEVMIGDVEGRTVTADLEDPELGSIQGRIAVAILDDERAILIIAATPSDELDEDVFTSLLESFEFSDVEAGGTDAEDLMEELDPQPADNGDDEDSNGDDEDSNGDDEDSNGDDEDSNGDDEDSNGDDEDSNGDDEDEE
jgi:hypothetical protein